jgi:subtilisin family serine protease
MRDLLLPDAPRRPPDRNRPPGAAPVAEVGPPQVVERVTTRALERTGAGEYHAWGYDGSGVKVAIIDEGFQGLDDLIQAGELPPDVVTRRFTREGVVTRTLSAESAHGAACAEIVHDLAPGAQLYLIEVEDLIANFAAIFDDLAREQVQIVSISMALAPRHRGDGRGLLGDPPVPIYDLLDDARAQGMLVIKSAGNDAQRHYAGAFTDENGNSWHEFGTTREGGRDETLAFQVQADGLMELFLTWDDWGDDPLIPAARADYDLALFDAQGREIARSARDQAGRSVPVDVLNVTPATSGIFTLRVKKGGEFVENHTFHIFARKGIMAFNEYQVPGWSLSPPADASSVLAVGAARVYDDALAPYSAQGPTADGRIKPDLTSYTDVAVASPGYEDGFSGTSAAAPHVAGLAALLQSRAAIPLSPDEIEARLFAAAADKGQPGQDTLWGAGLAQLPPLDPHVKLLETRPAAAGVPPDRFTVRVAVHRSDGSRIVELDTTAFRVTLDEQTLTLLTVRQLGEGYLLETRPLAPINAGMHILTVHALDAHDTAEIDLARALTAAVAPRLDVRATAGETVQEGDLVRLQASLTAQRPITGAWVRGTVQRPSHEDQLPITDTLTLFDDGLHHDGVADDGVYGATYRRLTEPGTYHFTFVATYDDVQLNAGLSIDAEAIDAFQADEVPNNWEHAVGLDILNDDLYLDPDGDGLINREEYRAGADPHDRDTDGDGLTDGDEIGGYYATDPANPDTDLGGVSDAEEMQRRTNPLDPTDDERAQELLYLP